MAHCFKLSIRSLGPSRGFPGPVGYGTLNLSGSRFLATRYVCIRMLPCTLWSVIPLYVCSHLNTIVTICISIVSPFYYLCGAGREAGAVRHMIMTTIADLDASSLLVKRMRNESSLQWPSKMGLLATTGFLRDGYSSRTAVLLFTHRSTFVELLSHKFSSWLQLRVVTPMWR